MGFNGIYLGMTPKGAVWFNEDAHMLTIAQSGGGKNTSLIMPNLLMNRFQGSKIILDLKGENAAVCSYWKNKRNDGQAHRLNPWKIFGMSSIKYNPFCVLDAYSENLYEDCVQMAESIVLDRPNQSDTGEHFDELARDFITIFLLCLTVRDRIEPPTPASLYREIVDKTVSATSLGYVVQDLKDITHPDSYIKEAMELGAKTLEGIIANGDSKEFGSVKTTLTRYLKSFRSRVLTETVSADKEKSYKLLDFLFTRKGNNDLYLCIPQKQLSNGRVWLRLLLRSFTIYLMRNLPKKKVLFLLDEFPQLGNFQPILDDAAYLRGYGVRFWFIAQNIGQFKLHYGEQGMEIIMENCKVKQFFNIEDATAKYVSEKLGKDSFMIKDLGTRQYRSTYTEDIMSRTEVEQFKMVVNFITGQKPKLLSKKSYYEIPEISTRALPNPLFYGLDKWRKQAKPIIEDRAMLLEKIRKEKD